MDKRKLGRSGIEVAPLCFGGNVFGWTADEPTSFTLLDAFTAAGFNLIDTSDVYSSWAPGNEGGESETVLGNWMASRGNRSKVVIATKVGAWAKQPGLKPANILAACEGSLKRLKTDYIDVYQTHVDDLDTPQDDVLETYQKLIAAGKVRVIGASNFDVPRLDSSLRLAADKGLPRYQTLQPRYNMIERQFEKELQPFCVREGIGVIPYFGLAAGFLSGKYRSLNDTEGKARARHIAGMFTPENMAVLDRLDKVATARNVPMAEVAIAWLRDRPAVVAPIASSTNLDQLHSLMRGAMLKLSAEEVATLDG